MALAARNIRCQNSWKFYAYLEYPEDAGAEEVVDKANGFGREVWACVGVCRCGCGCEGLYVCVCVCVGVFWCVGVGVGVCVCFFFCIRAIFFIKAGVVCVSSRGAGADMDVTAVQTAI